MKKSVIVLLFFMSMNFHAQHKNMWVASDDLGSYFTKKQVYDKYDCGGNNISPSLEWGDVPEGTKSFAVTMFVPDAPGKGWWHWLAFNIPADVRTLPAGAGNPAKALMPEGVVQSINDFKEYGYGGPCPPKGHGVHTYVITVYALDVPHLDLPADASPWKVKEAIQKHMLAKAEYMAFYERK